MADAITVSGPISGTDRTLTFETGQLAYQADGAVVVKVGGTTVLVTATASRKVREGTDFFPLTVDVEERMYAAGKIPGSFFRREGRAGDQATLTARLTDRPLRPSFPEGFRNDVHVVAMILGVDLENPHDVLVINGASAALMISGIPFDGPIGAVRMAFSTEGKWMPHCTYQEGDDATFELVVAGRALSEEPDAEIAIMMVEAGGTEHAWQYYEDGAPKVTEEVVAAGLEAAKTWIRESIELQRELVAKAGKKPAIPFDLFVDYTPEIAARVAAVGESIIEKANAITTKTERNQALDVATDEIVALLASEFEGREREIRAAVRSATKRTVRRRIVEDGVRIDGRTPTDIRPLAAKIGILATAHGSGLFERGLTQVLNVTTLGMPRMNQLLDTLGIDETKRYIHHYNFPPFSVGEAGRMMGPRRRDIGHGLLAERALLPVIPPADEFPYTLRLVSDVLSSDGSTSMGSVCGSTLSLMDAGVPIKAPVAGIAMGLIFAEGKYTTLTDISGAEDAFGDMDFKVAGTSEFVTALQLDTKIDGLPADVLARALQQAREARLVILDVMAEAISTPADDVKPHAPKIVAFEIPMDKIGEVIGPKGKVINAIQQETGADIAVDDDGMVGTVTIGAKESIAVNEARRRIELILDPPVAEVGATYEGKVVNITKFGAFVNILPGRDGLLHISRLGGGKRIERVEDVLSLGQPVSVVVDDIDPQGKISLSLVGEDAPAAPRRESAPAAERTAEVPAAEHHVETEEAPVSGGIRRVSFEDSFQSSLEAEFGDLGPADTVEKSAVRVVEAVRGAERSVELDANDRDLRPPFGDPIDHRSDARSALGFGGLLGRYRPANERAGEAGISHFLEHLLFKGTEDRSARSIAEDIDAVGGDMNAYTTKEYTTFYLRLLAGDLPLGLDILQDIMTAPAFRSGEVDAERKVILEEVLMHLDEPADVVYERFSEAIFPGHPLGREVLGDTEVITSVAVDEIRGFFERHYRPANMVVAAAGDVDHDRLAEEIECRFDRPGGAPPVREAPGVAPGTLDVTHRDSEQAHLVLGVRGPNRRAPERYALSILNHTLGGGLSSRLFQKVREERGLCYSIASDRIAYSDAGALAVSVGTSPEQAFEVLKIVTEELATLASEGISDKELTLAKGHLQADLLLSLEDSGSRMSRIGASLLLHDEVPAIEAIAERIEAVTLEEVAALAASVLGGPRTLAVVGPFEADDFVDIAAGIAAS